MASLCFDFGARAQFNEDQLNTIRWLRHLGAQVRLKKNHVKASFHQISYERYSLVVSQLEKEEIGYQLVD